jgi:uncharacterized protein YrrD
MLHTLLQNVKGIPVMASDGEIGQIIDVYFDDAEWACRHFVIKTGGWLDRRDVLLAPYAVRRIDWDRAVMEVDLTRDLIRKGPNIDTAMPVSRQHEITLFDYYGYPYYWSGPYVWGPFPSAELPLTAQKEVDEATKLRLEIRAREREQFDPHLRSANEVAGYKIEASDGSIGELDDLLFKEEDWTLQFLVIDTRKWLPGKHVVVPVDWVDRVSWGEHAVFVALTKDDVRRSPKYDPDVALTAELESGLHSHYGRPQPGFAGVR